MAKKPIEPILRGGTFVGRVTPGGPLLPMADPGGPQSPDAWICRRVADYPADALAPLRTRGAQQAVCVRCGAAILYNPARLVDAPKICMQCAGIQPLPWTD